MGYHRSAKDSDRLVDAGAGVRSGECLWGSGNWRET
jgi:hypothetical protein